MGDTFFQSSKHKFFKYPNKITNRVWSESWSLGNGHWSLFHLIRFLRCFEFHYLGNIYQISGSNIFFVYLNIHFKNSSVFFRFQDVPPDYETIGTIFGYALLVLSWILIIITFPFSMCVCLKVNKIISLT